MPNTIQQYDALTENTSSNDIIYNVYNMVSNNYNEIISHFKETKYMNKNILEYDHDTQIFYISSLILIYQNL